MCSCHDIHVINDRLDIVKGKYSFIYLNIKYSFLYIFCGHNLYQEFQHTAGKKLICIYQNVTQHYNE